MEVPLPPITTNLWKAFFSFITLKICLNARCYNMLMVERNPDLSQLFPNPQRRTLVEKFIGDISTRPAIEKLVTVDTGIEEPYQRLIVFSEGADHGFPTSCEQDEVVFAKKHACSSRAEGELLGYIPIFTEPLFNTERQYYEELVGKEIHILWEKTK